MLYLTLLYLLIITPQDKKTIHLSEDLILDKDQLIGTYITDITTGEQGEIVVALYDLPGVKVFDEEGALMHRFGQRGRGPGDFRNLRSVSMYHGRIFALDSGPNAKINIFNTADPEAVETIGLPPLRTETALNSVVDLKRIDDEHFLATYRPMTSNKNIGEALTSSYYLVNSTNRDDKTLIFESPMRERYVTQTEGGFINTEMPFGRSNHVALLDDKLFHMWTGDDKIQVYDTINWNHTGHFTVDDVAEPIAIEENDYKQYHRERLGLNSEEDIKDLRDRAVNDRSLQMILRSVSSMSENRDVLHDTFPVYNQLLSDGDHLWITAHHADRSVQHLLQLDATGNVLAAGTLPGSVEIKHINDAHLYGVDEDENGFTTLVRYMLEIQ